MREGHRESRAMPTQNDEPSLPMNVMNYNEQSFFVSMLAAEKLHCALRHAEYFGLQGHGERFHLATTQA